MNRTIEQAVARLRAEKVKRRRSMSILTALAVLVGGNVCWTLRETGTALTDPDLTAEQVDCNVDDVLISAENPRPLDADPEVTLPDFTGYSRKEKIACIAESQCGYTESLTDFETDAATGEQHGKTRYGEWYGNPYGPWNTMFACYCLYIAGVEDIPFSAGCWTWSVSLEEAGLLIPASEADPTRGDVILIDADLDGQADRCGIVTLHDEEALTVVEGDHDGEVIETQYAVADEQILGYVSLPESDAEPDVNAEEATEEPVYTAFHELSASGVRVDASAPAEAFPDGTVMVVTDVPREEALEAAADKLPEDMEQVDAVAVDISFIAEDGTELEPDAAVNVQITLPEELQLQEGSGYSLLHIADSGEVQEVEAECVSADGAVFEADSFSMYIVTSNVKQTIAQAMTANNQENTNNSQDVPYILEVGEELVIRYEGEYVNCRMTVSGNDGLPNNKHHLNPGSIWDQNEDEGYYARSFVGDIPGECRVVMLKDDSYNTSEDNIAEGVWVRVVNHKIKVRREFDEVDKDYLKEYLGGYNMPVQNDHIPNNIEGYGGRPYSLRPGDVVRLRADGEGTFTFDSSYFQELTPETIDGKQYHVYKALDNPGLSSIQLKDGQGNLIDEMFINILNPSTIFSHADMEIADDGVYTFEEEHDGIKTVKIYKAFVDGINSATRVLDANGDLLPEEPIPPEAYLKIGTPGMGQYEVTSAYYSQNYPVGALGWQTAYDGPHTKVEFPACEAKSVVFDVRLLLRPYEQYTVDTTTGEQSEAEPFTGDDIIVPSTIFNLSGQSMIDAMNKCPMSNGYDFTIRIDLNEKVASVSAIPEAKKVLTNNGVPLKEGQFTFELLSPTYSLDYASSLNNKMGELEDGHLYDAFQLNTDTWWGNGYVNVDNYNYEMRQKFGLQNQEIGELIDRYIAGTASPINDPTESEFYNVLSKHLNQANAVRLSSTTTLDPKAWAVLDYEVIETATNDEDGNIVFSPQVFFNPGTYYYYMREKVDSSDANVQSFDEILHRVTITVDDNLQATITYDDGNSTTPTFTNTLNEYALPSTGGTGIWPYALGGTALIGTALLLLRRRRREA